MRGWSLAASFVLASSVLLCGGKASAGDAAAARALFDEGRKLVSAGKYEAACPKFEASLQLSPGLGTRFNLAECWEHVGRTASAWAEYLGVAAAAKSAGQAEREKVARERAAAIEPHLARLIVEVKATDANIEVRRGETPVARAMWGTAVPTDPGRHVVEARAPGKKTWSSTVEVPKSGGTVKITVPALEDAPVAATSQPGQPLQSAPAAPTAAGTGPAQEAAAPTGGSATTAGLSTSNTLTSDGYVAPSSPSASGQRTIGYLVGGLGVIGLGVGAAFGAMTISKNNEAAGICVGEEQLRCPDDQLRRHDALWNDANTYRTVAIASLIGGGVALATGAVLVFTAPKRIGASAGAARWAVAPMLGPGTAGTFVHATW